MVHFLLLLLLLLLFKLQLDELEFLVRNCLVLDGLALEGVVLLFEFLDDIFKFLDSF